MTPPLPQPPRDGWLARIVEASARKPLTVVVAVAALAVWGWYALRRAPLDAIPDLSDTQVVVATEWPGQSPDLVERYVTQPVSAALLATRNVQFVRSQSSFGLSFVYVIFEDGTDLIEARRRVGDAVAQIERELPSGARPKLGPDATGVGWVLEYALVPTSPVFKRPGPAVGSHRHKPVEHHVAQHVRLAQVRAFQDATVRHALETVPGVAEVASVGGMNERWEVRLDPAKLHAHGLGVDDVARAIDGGSGSVGGGTIEIAEHEHVLRGRGAAATPEDIASALVAPGPVLVRDLGQVVRAQVHTRGIADLDGKGEVVGGIVIMRNGANALDVIAAAKQRLDELRASLPKDCELVVTYDRSQLILSAIDTLRGTLIEEMIAVSVIIFLFLLHVRSALVPILMIPVAVLLAFVPMLYQGLTANIMSLGGIVVAIGAMVDASIVMVENVHQKLAERGGDRVRLPLLIEAMQEVAAPIFLALLVTAIAFLPVLALQGTEGRLFRPLAFTKTYSMGCAAILSITLTPALAALFVRGRLRLGDRNVLNRLLIAVYAPVVRFAIRRRGLVIALSLGAMLATVPVFWRLESEFMPPLDEGSLLYMPTAPHGMAMDEASRVLQRIDRELRAFPEVASVFGKMGRAETATDPAPMGMAETIVLLRPEAEWRAGMTRERLLGALDDAIRVPGMSSVRWMPIQTRTEMLATGIRSPLGIQVFGNDLATLERTAIAIERAVAKVPGTRSAFAERASGGFYIDISVKRDELVRHGLRVDDVLGVVETIGGRVVSRAGDGRSGRDVAIRFAESFDDDPQRLGEVLVKTPAGDHVPLARLADIKFAMGPATIQGEGGQLAMVVFVDTDRPIADYVADARRAVAAEVALPTGVRIAWAGQFRNFERARDRLQLLLPITLLLIALLLHANTRSWVETGIVLLAVPFSLIGAVWLLWLLGYQLSVAVWVGMIALAGLDAETGVVMLLYLRMAHDGRRRAGRLHTHADLDEAIVEGAAKRVRPKVMTVMTMLIGLVPVLWCTGAGADVMRRIAAPMVGGLVSSFLLELTVYPAVYAVWKRQALRAKTDP